MISLVDRTISRGGRVWPVARCEVWWRTPLGLHTTLDDALAACKPLEMDPRFSVVPVAVAVAEDGTHEEFK